jgi:hypothetical protein
MFLAGVGGLLGGNNEINPLVERHPPDAASALPELKRKLHAGTDRRPHVRVVTRDGATIVGKLAKIQGDSIFVRGPGGQVVVQATSIQRIDSMGDPVWDQMLLGAVGGATWAVIAANNCSDDPVTYVSRGRMAVIGAVIVGTTGLVLDLLHDGKFVRYRPSGAPGATTVRVTPMLRTSGAGVGIVVLF